MTVTKLVRLDAKFDREVYISHIGNPNIYNGFYVDGFIASSVIGRTVNDTRELERVRIYYQNQ